MQHLEIDNSIDIAPPLETVIHGKYRLVRMLGEGASSWVYEAKHHTIDTLTFAVKVLKPTYARDPDVVQRFKREAFTVANLRSPHSVHVTDFGMSEHDLPYLVMDYVEGVSLAEMIERHGKLTDLQVARFTLGVLDALEDAHGLGIVHRDLKPSNIICALLPGSSLPAAKVLDFGIAKMLLGDDQNAAGADDTVEGVVFCSPRYASPEVLLGRPSLQSDIYSLGIAMIEALQGQPPYAESNKILVAAHHLGPDPVPVFDDLKESPFYPIVRKACAKELSHRYPDASQMLRDVQQLYDELLEEHGDEELRALDISVPERPECFSGTPTAGSSPSLSSPMAQSAFGTGPHTRPMPKPVMAGQSSSGTGPVMMSDGSTTTGPMMAPGMTSSVQDQGKTNIILIAVAIIVVVGSVIAAVSISGRDNASATAPAAATDGADPGTPAEAGPSTDEIARAFRTATNRVGQATSIPREHRFTFRTNVDGAVATADGVPLAALPLEDAFGPSVRPLMIEVNADGHQPFSTTFEASGPINYLARLTPVGAEPEPEPEPSVDPEEEARRRAEREARRAERERDREREAEPEPEPEPVQEVVEPEPEPEPEPDRHRPSGGSDLRDPFGR